MGIYLIKFLRSVSGLFWLTVFVLSAGCGYNQPGRSFDTHTQASEAFSSRLMVADGFGWWLYAQAIILRKPENVIHYVRLEYHSEGSGTGYAKFNSAWSYGHGLPYVKRGKEVLSCSYRNKRRSCSKLEEGAIVLTGDLFRLFAQGEFAFRLVGQNSSVSAKVPGELFRQALKAANSTEREK